MADGALRELVNLALLFVRSSGAETRPASVRAHRGRVTATGAVHDAFLPTGAPRSAWVAVHGMTRNGKDDVRLQRFAGALARVGASCAVPSLPGLSELRLDEGDVAVVAETVRALADGCGTRVNLVGFSYGGSYGLLAAATPDLKDIVGHVVAFGAYNSLSDVGRWQATLLAREPRVWAERDGWLYLNLAVAWRSREALRLGAEEISVLDSVLHRYCDVATAPEKEVAYVRCCAGRDLRALVERSVDRAHATALSPRGQLGGLSCGVSLVHDRDDVLVPTAEAEALRRELLEASRARSVDLATTGLLRHVRPTAALRPQELLHLARVLRPLVRSWR